MSYVVWFMGDVNSILTKPVTAIGTAEWRVLALIVHEVSTFNHPFFFIF